MTQESSSRFEQQLKELTDRFRGYLVQKGARILMVLAAAVVGLVAIGSLAWQSLREPEAKGPAAQAPPPFLGGGELPPDPVLPGRGKGLEERELARAAQQRAVSEADAVLATLDELLAELDRFENEKVALLADERGKGIAGNREAVKQFRAVTERENLVTREKVRQLRSLTADLVAPAKRAIADPKDARLPSEALFKELDGLQHQAWHSRDAYRARNGQLEALVDQAKRLGTRAAVPLAESVRAQRHDEALADLAEVEAARQRGRKDAAKEVAKAAEDAERVAGDIEAQAITDKAAAAKAKADAAAKERQAAAEKERLRKLARSAETRNYLGCLFAKGFMQPREWQGAFMAFERDTQELPLSLSKIRGLHALDKSKAGLENLNWIVGDAKNDRPRWAFGHVNSWSADAQRFVQKAQDLLVELGPTLVEEGLLAP